MMPMPNQSSPKIGVAGILMRDDGRVLLAQRAHAPGTGTWAFPGGSVHVGEALKTAAVREFLEETGLEVTVGPLVHVAEIIGADTHVVVLDYLVSALHYEARAGSDAAGLQWVGADQWQALDLAPAMRNCLESAEVRSVLGWASL